MGLSGQVREHCAAVAARARWVTIDEDALEGVDPGPEPSLDPVRHYLEGAAENVAAYMLALDSINFGSGWFPTLRKRPACSGYNTIAWALADHWRANGPWSDSELRRMEPERIALVLGQDPGHELMALYSEALRQLGSFLRGRGALEAVEAADGSAQRLAALLAHSMPFYDDTGFWKRAQIVPSDLALAGVAEFSDLDSLTIFADNLVPHVLRVDGVLRYHPGLAAHIDAGRLLPPGDQEEEIRACAVHACETIARRLGVAPRSLDNALWNRGQAPRYKAIPRHRTRSVFY